MRNNNSRFIEDISKISGRMRTAISKKDFYHLRRFETFGRICTLAGYASAWIAPNPLSMLFIAQGIHVRWNSAHAVLHGGYNHVPGAGISYNSKGFGRGILRVWHWLDWISPDAWAYEHNSLHHRYTGESKDPDIVERRFKGIRNSKFPLPTRILLAMTLACTWKWIYYAPSTLMLLHKKKGISTRKGNDFYYLFNPRTIEGRIFWTKCLLPYGLIQFLCKPICFFLISPWSAFSVFLNSLGAELLANLWGFITIAPNHTGADVYRFDQPCQDKEESLIRQIIGSANYEHGSSFKNFLFGYTNYQIDHHVWPSMPLLKYVEYSKELEAVCLEHGINFIREPLITRWSKTLRVCVGLDSMGRFRKDTASIETRKSG